MILPQQSDFQIIQTLQTRATHVVYEAVLPYRFVAKGLTSDGTDLTVRLIVFSPEVSQDFGFRRGFKTDRGFLETLRHKSIARFLGDAESDGQIFFWTEPVQGVPISRWIDEHRAVAAEDLIEIGWQACSALQQAHNLGFTHGGISPDSVCVSDEMSVTLVDFGVTRWLQSSQARADVTIEKSASRVIVTGYDWRGGVRTDLTDLCRTLQPLAGASTEDAPSGSAKSLRRLLDRVTTAESEGFQLSARDLQGRLGEILIADGDAIEIVDRREHSSQARWSILDDVFPPAPTTSGQAENADRQRSPKVWQILLLLGVLAIVVLLLTIAALLI